MKKLLLPITIIVFSLTGCCFYDTIHEEDDIKFDIEDVRTFRKTVTDISGVKLNGVKLREHQISAANAMLQKKHGFKVCRQKIQNLCTVLKKSSVFVRK